MSEDPRSTGVSSRAGVKARARLALRAEKAFGLTSLPAGGPSEVDPAPATGAPARSEAAAAVLPPVARPVAAFSAAPVPAAPAPSKDIFGQPEAAKRKPSALPVIAPTEPITTPELEPTEKRQRLAALDADEVKGCTRCRLCETRTNTVFGEGDPSARLMFVGEGPGENEDLEGRPFVGRAGQLLDKQIAAMGLRREQVFIANVVKCRPPGNRTPSPDEAATCQPYLERQIEIVRPRVIVTLGLTASQYLLQVKTTMGRMRGNWHFYRGVKVMPTFHPAYILRSYTREVREAVWSDLQKVMEELGLSKP